MKNILHYTLLRVLAWFEINMRKHGFACIAKIYVINPFMLFKFNVKILSEVRV
jgi:hypothetical protein